jgi:hypothetical protein
VTQLTEAFGDQGGADHDERGDADREEACQTDPIHPPEATRAILDCVGLASRPPPVRPPVPDTTLDLEVWF